MEFPILRGKVGQRQASAALLKFWTSGPPTGRYPETGFAEIPAGSAFDRTTLPPSRFLARINSGLFVIRPNRRNSPLTV
jgi:hypothetical protein